MALALCLVLFLAVLDSGSALASRSACSELQDALLAMRDSLKFVESKDDYSYDVMQASWMGIDLEDDDQITSLACQLVEAESMDDVLEILPKADAYNIRYYVSMLTEPDNGMGVIKDIKGVLDFLEATKAIPNFPLGLTEYEATRALNKAGILGVRRLFPGDSEPNTTKKFNQLASALAEAQSVSQFNEMTSGAYTHFIANIDAIREQLQAQYRAVQERPAIIAHLVDVLNKSGLMDIFMEE